MKRREFVMLSGGAMIALAPPAQAQPAGAMRKIGVLDPNQVKAERLRIAAFREGLAALGWIDGQNVRFEIRYADGELTRLPNLAADLIDTAPDAILAINSPSVIALRRMTHSIPVVFVAVSDPVGQGLVGSLARPGGNITGFSNYNFTMASKWLQLLKEIAPRLTRVVILFDTNVSSYRGFVSSIEAAAKPAGIQTTALRFQNAGDVQRIADLGREPGTGLITLPGDTTGNSRDAIITLVARLKLPAIYTTPLWTPVGGLMSYTDDPWADARRAASDIDRILHGTKPADLPVQNPTKFRLSINLKTAKVMGLTVPQALLIQADDVIR